MLPPESVFKKWWNYFVVLLVMYNTLFIILETVTLPPTTPALQEQRTAAGEHCSVLQTLQYPSRLSQLTSQHCTSLNTPAEEPETEL